MNPHPTQLNGEQNENREVFAVEEIPFDVALEVVKRRMIEESLALPDALDDISFEAKRNFEKGVDCRWSFWVKSERYFGETIEDAKAKRLTPRQKAELRIGEIQRERARMEGEEATLRAELARLESEGKAWCVLGAIERAHYQKCGTSGYDKFDNALLRVRESIKKLFPDRATNGTVQIGEFNDHPETTFEDVQKVLKEAGL